MKLVLFLILCSIIQAQNHSYSAGCEKCKKMVEDCRNNSRYPSDCYSIQYKCDHMCDQAEKEKKGEPTDADNRSQAEAKFSNINTAYYISLNEHEKEIYNRAFKFIQEEIPRQQAICYQQYSYYINGGFNDNFAINLCVTNNLEALTYKSNPRAFKALMNILEIKKDDWSVADVALSYAITQILAYTY
jgi:hypothetical protein